MSSPRRFARGPLSGLRRQRGQPTAERAAGPRAPDARPAAVPDGHRIYAIGDVHGELGKLEEMIALISADLARLEGRRPVVVFLGDYVDRGLDSRGVLERLMGQSASGAIWPGVETRFLAGNHEAQLLAFLERPTAAARWLDYGGDATLISYGLEPAASDDPPERLQEAACALAERICAGQRAFLASLETQYRAGDYLFVHAGIRPGRPLEAQLPHDLLWIREPFLSSDGDHGVRVVHGHSIVEAPQLLHNRIALDTGAYAGGPLSCVVLEGSEARLLQTRVPGRAA